jgi:phenylacetate-CoA ligase
MGLSLLQQLLKRYESLTFDVEEYLLSTKYVDHLQRRFAAFREGMHEIDSSPLRNKILNSINGGELDHIAYYALQKKGYASFEDLPFIEKDDIRAHPSQYVSSSVSIEDSWTSKSYGTTGRAINICYSNEYYFDVLYLPIRKAAACLGLKECTASSVYAIGIGEAGDFVLVDPTNGHALYLELRIDPDNPASRHRVQEAICELKPRFISSRPNLFNLLLDEGLDLDLDEYRPQAVMSGGEVLSLKTRRRLEEFFGCKVVNRYGMSEVGLIATECMGGYLHIDTSAHYLEIVKESGQPAEPGEIGQIVISGLGNRVMPLIRYKTRDVGAIDLSPCECGHRSPRLVNFGGRKLPNFTLPNGQAYSPFPLTSVLFDTFPNLNEFQVVQESSDVLSLLVEFAVTPPDQNDQMRSMAEIVRSALPVRDIEVRCNAVQFSKTRKFERFRSLI